MIFRCASISWFEVVSRWVIDIFTASASTGLSEFVTWEEYLVCTDFMQICMVYTYKMYRFHCRKWGLLQWYMWQQLSCYWLYLGILAERFILCIKFYIFHLCCNVICGSNSHCISIFSSWNASTGQDTKWRSNDKSTWRSRIFILFLASFDIQLQIQVGVKLFYIKHDFVLQNS